MEFQVWKFVGFRTLPQRACAAAIALLCLPFGGCIRTEQIVIDPSNPSGTTLVSFNGHFTAEPGAVDPLGSSSPVILENFSQYWMAAGDPITATWSNYSLGFRCPKVGASAFTPNICQPDNHCAGGGQFQVCTLQPPQSCSDHHFILSSLGPLAVSSGDEVHLAGEGSALNVWLLQHTCVNGTCGMGAPVSTTSWLWPAGCSPTAVSYTPTVDASMGGDVSLQLWASRRTDFAGNPAPLPPDTDNDDQPGPVLKVSAVGTMPRRNPNRQHFILSCGPPPPSGGMAPPACFTQGDDTESQWITRQNDSPTAEGFSSRLRVREIRAFATETDADPMPPLAFCSAFINGQRSTEARSNCDASGGMQTQDCRAVPTVDFSPGDRWKVSFSDKPGAGNTPSRCPNDFSRAEMWVEFTLEKRP